MDVVYLSRLQFAIATCFHFLFVPLTLGLSVLVAMMETMFVWKHDETYREMAKFWGKLLLINYAIGVVTGITLEFQFGTNWSRYSAFVGDIFGSLLAIEATLAFFLESTFIAVWFLGWKKLSPRVHLLAIWLVAIASNVSAFWILAANAWMQHPVGFVLRHGRAELTDFCAVITQPFAILEFLHTIGGAYILSGFFVAGIAAWHMRRKNMLPFFKKSFSIAITFALLSAGFEILQGHLSAEILGRTQPAKLAAMEAQWETRKAAPLHMFLWPDVKNERNAIEALPIPRALSILSARNPNAEVRGLKSFPPNERPPVLPTFLSFRVMVGLGFLFFILALWGWWKRNSIDHRPCLLRVMVWIIPLPYLACELGWMLAEVGRQPWLVYGVMRTSAGVSTLHVSQVATTTIGFLVLYTLLGLADFYLLMKYARRGPESVLVHLPSTPECKV